MSALHRTVLLLLSDLIAVNLASIFFVWMKFVGGSLDNALIIGDDGPLNQGGFRMENEPARHKLLDVLGDLLLVGGIPRAKVELYRPGHCLMHALAMKMAPFCS